MACAFSPRDSTDILIASSVFDGLISTHESSSIIALTPSSVSIEYDSLLKISGSFLITAWCSEELATIFDRICVNCDANFRHSSTIFLSSVEIVAAHVNLRHDKPGATALAACVSIHIKHLADDVCLTHFRVCNNLTIALLDVFLYCNTGVDACHKLFQAYLKCPCDAQQQCG